MTKPSTPLSVFAERRKRLISAIGDAILILPAAKEQVRNRDCYYSFRQDSDFLYLSNFNEAEAVMVLDGFSGESILFSKPYDAFYNTWQGEIIGQERAKDEYLFDQSYSLDIIPEKLSQYCHASDTIISPFSRYPEFDNLLLKHIKKAKETRRARAPQNWLNSDQFIHPMRLIKDEHEIATMRFAAEISIAAHQAAMQAQASDEAELAALMDYHFKSQAAAAAYESIVAGGEHACTLHYTVNNAPLNNDDLVLIDAGCEIDGYAADITRTFPVSGTFSEPQKRVYEWVLKAMDAALAACKAGNTIGSLHVAARDVLINAMLDLGLLSGTVVEIKASNQDQQYFMHGTSHWLGIDVHDVGDYKDENGNWLTLEPGMVLTIEPGLYIRKDDNNAPKALRGIGVRIEDDIIITPTGHINLTEKMPKTVADIEKICQLKG